VGVVVRRGNATPVVAPVLVRDEELLVQTGSQGRGGDLSGERVVVVEAETCRANSQVLGDKQVIMRPVRCSSTGYLVVQAVKYSDRQPYARWLMLVTWWALVQALVSRPQAW
jgi:hypothetical protein